MSYICMCALICFVKRFVLSKIISITYTITYISTHYIYWDDLNINTLCQHIMTFSSTQNQQRYSPTHSKQKASEQQSNQRPNQSYWVQTAHEAPPSAAFSVITSVKPHLLRHDPRSLAAKHISLTPFPCSSGLGNMHHCSVSTPMVRNLSSCESRAAQFDREVREPRTGLGLGSMHGDQPTINCDKRHQRFKQTHGSLMMRTILTFMIYIWPPQLTIQNTVLQLDNGTQQGSV